MLRQYKKVNRNISGRHIAARCDSDGKIDINVNRALN